MNKTEFYADLNRDFKALMAGETSFLATLANTSALLFERLSDLNWAGFYLLEGETLVLGPFQGKLACVRIPVGRGVCGTAVAENQVQRVEEFMRLPGTSPVMPPVILKSFCRWWSKIRLLAFWTSTVRSSVALQARTNRGCASWWRIWKTYSQQPIIKNSLRASQDNQRIT